jgi:serine/threonine-protein kinase
MRAAANLAFGLVLMVVCLLSLGAWRFVVRPIRRLVKAQSRITGATAGGGGEIAQLQSAFERLEHALEDRDALSEVFLDRFQILKILGSGAMGTVYLGWDPKLSRKVALKTIRLSGDISSEERERLANRLLLEGKTAAKLTHGNIVTVYDVVGDERHAFIAMQYIEGESVEEIIERDGVLSPAQVAEIAEDVLSGLVAAHREQVIHRDIKPANIMRSQDGAYMLSDFGIASMRDQVARGDEGLVLGTPGYLAPESYASKVHNAQTDLFALGVTLVECLTGRRPFSGKSLEQIISRTATDPVVMPAPVMTGMPKAMRSFVDQLLEKRPKDRFKTAQEGLDALLEFKADMGGLGQVADGHTKQRAQQTDRQAEATSRVDVGGGTRRIDP